MRRVGLLLVVVVMTACGDAPLGEVGQRSSDWINEPEVVTTTVPPVTIPRFVDIANLEWANDDIVNSSLSDPDALIAEVFERRQGDRFIQASREEISAALPEVRFPAVAPHGAEWISSQLVIENTGLLSSEPTAAFGIWSAEPYTRSRSVAQMVVLEVAIDPETAAEVAATGEGVSCARFSERSTNICEIVNLDGKQVWQLDSGGGTTMIWFEGDYRYELSGKSFVAVGDLARMASETIALGELRPVGS